ncbi:conserved hypothetical protein [Leishmania braziliensis MHOM/BR/75/M2904]|uniref:Uncharacterized protein n=4 Tax=Viannia TaxID=37616 RepID=A4HQF2_LEIBR|nr:conserved hypothetical protein [Leishmania braziliensis MHOM/BR/75/M2904]KAI5691688.1 hypothetical protein MNV84_08421 [Leishmania braziliensis]CAJ2482264.1 unnamed protein product [Leishmania braziliensis]CAM44418.1 conserved hypothetical protein [Leishmania braziliensis MHOM/BR/75/M2904]SYZ70496.1 hypothetical_protein [Leishmania braziliensis MHOM/BR/75/M2904]
MVYLLYYPLVFSPPPLPPMIITTHISGNDFVMCEQIDSSHRERQPHPFHQLKCSRSIRNRAAVVYHLTCATLHIEVPQDVLFSASLSYALHISRMSAKCPTLGQLRSVSNETDIVAVEMLILEFVRPHVVLIEGCLRLELKRLVVHRPLPLKIRECVGRVAIALSDTLYAYHYCLFPEAAARACLLNACERLGIDVDSATLPDEFRTPQVAEIRAFFSDA